MGLRVKSSVPLLVVLATALASSAGLATVLSREQWGVVWAVLGTLVAWYVVLVLEGKNLASFPLIFATIFILYTLGPTLEGALVGIGDSSLPREVKIVLLKYDVPFSFIALLTNVAMLGFAIGLAQVYAKANSPNVAQSTNEVIQPRMSSYAPTWLYYLGMGAFLLGFALSLLDLSRAGGLQAILTPRVERLSVLAESRGSLPSAPFVFSGLAVAVVGWIHGRSQKSRGLLLTAMVGLWFVYLLVQGDRRYFLYTFLVALGIIYVYRGFSPKLTLRSSLVIVLIILLLSAFGTLRWMIPPLLQGSMSPGEAWTWLTQNFSWSWFAFSSNEFMGPYITLVATTSDPNWQALVRTPLGGLSYFYAIPNLLPRSLYPGEKWESLSFKFSRYVYTTYLPPDFPAAIGFGFSPLAEACLNFGLTVWSPFAVFLLWGWLFGWLKIWLRKGSVFWGVAYALLLPQAFNLNRIDFIWAFQEAVYFAVVGFFLLALAYVLSLSTQKVKKLSGGWSRVGKS